MSIKIPLRTAYSYLYQHPSAIIPHIQISEILLYILKPQACTIHSISIPLHFEHLAPIGKGYPFDSGIEPQPTFAKMCFYDQYRMICNCHKWGHFRQHCSKEYRTGETCGMKLIMNTLEKPEKCKICTKIDTKEGRVRKEQDRINRWVKEEQRGHQRGASIEASQGTIEKLYLEIEELKYQKSQNMASTR